MPSLSRSRFPTLLCAVAVLLAFAPASAALPYSSICDGEGNVPDSQALGEALLGHPESLIPIYEDSQRRVPRAVKCWQQLEAIYQGVGRGMAEVASGPRCVMADVLPYCRPGGEAFDLLSKAGPGGERLKTLALAAFEERMRELRPHRVLIESAATLAMAGSVAGKQLAGVKAAETRELSKLKQESRAGAGEPMLSAELALLEEVELPREVLEFKLAEAEGAEKTGRMTANLGSLEKLRPIAERPQQAPR